MKKITAILFSLLILFSNMGWAVNTHFCGGHAVESRLSIGVKHLSCGMESVVPSCENTLKQNTKVSKTPCCEDRSHQLEVGENLAIAKLAFQKSESTSAFFKLPVFTNFLTAQNNLVTVPSSPPPLLNQLDFQILFQNFRI